MQIRNGNWMAFLAMSFAVVGLTGLFASVATPIPLERALARDAALDDAAAAARQPDPQAAIEALRSRLGDSAAALLPVGPDLAERIARERAAMRVRFLRDADNTEIQIRMMIGIITVAAAAFGIAILSIASRTS